MCGAFYSSAEMQSAYSTAQADRTGTGCRNAVGVFYSSSRSDRHRLPKCSRRILQLKPIGQATVAEMRSAYTTAPADRTGTGCRNAIGVFYSSSRSDRQRLPKVCSRRILQLKPIGQATVAEMQSAYSTAQADRTGNGCRNAIGVFYSSSRSDRQRLPKCSRRILQLKPIGQATVAEMQSAYSTAQADRTGNGCRNAIGVFYSSSRSDRQRLPKCSRRILQLKPIGQAPVAEMKSAYSTAQADRTGTGCRNAIGVFYSSTDKASHQND